MGAPPPHVPNNESSSALQLGRFETAVLCPATGPHAFPCPCAVVHSAGAAATLRVRAAATKQSSGAQKRAQARAARRAVAPQQRSLWGVLTRAWPPRGRRRQRQACTASRCVGCRRRTARQARRKVSTLRCSRRGPPLCRSCCTRRRTRCVSRNRLFNIGTHQATNPRSNTAARRLCMCAGQRSCHRRDRARS